MRLFLITAPTQDVITLEEAKVHLRVSGDGQDELIEALIAAVVAQIDPAGGGSLGRALRPQTWELRMPSFYACDSSNIELPYPPLVSVVSFKYDDTTGVEQTLTEDTHFRVLNEGGLGKQHLAPLFNGSWPSCRADEESVRIRYSCGYDGEVATDTLPAPIKQAAHLILRDLYSLGEQNLFLAGKSIAGVSDRRWVVSDAASAIINSAVSRLLSTYKVW
jgi:uncharacterized phiE125 gp8 family phage protein